jgi:shikimate dehydrogenase
VTRRPDTLLLGLIGADIEASRSPAMHEGEAAGHGLRCIYQRIDLTRLGLTCTALPELLTAARRLGFAGVNITHPCKQSAIGFMTDLSDEARAIGSVNTVVFDDDRRIGHNTDCYGFKRNFTDYLSGAALGRIAQLGAGGAGAATGYAALELGARELVIVDAIQERARSLAERLAATFSRPVYATEHLSEALQGADGLIHATPTGMFGHPGLAIPASLLRADLWVAEVVYFPLETELLRVAKRIGCRTMNGGGMAVHQAVEAFRLFTGLQADASRMRRIFETFDVSPGRDR